MEAEVKPDTKIDKCIPNLAHKVGVHGGLNTMTLRMQWFQVTWWYLNKFYYDKKKIILTLFATELPPLL